MHQHLLWGRDPFYMTVISVYHELAISGSQVVVANDPLDMMKSNLLLIEVFLGLTFDTFFFC